MASLLGETLKSEIRTFFCSASGRRTTFTPKGISPVQMPLGAAAGAVAGFACALAGAAQSRRASNGSVAATAARAAIVLGGRVIGQVQPMQVHMIHRGMR